MSSKKKKSETEGQTPEEQILYLQNRIISLNNSLDKQMTRFRKLKEKEYEIEKLEQKHISEFEKLEHEHEKQMTALERKQEDELDHLVNRHEEEAEELETKHEIEMKALKAKYMDMFDE